MSVTTPVENVGFIRAYQSIKRDIFGIPYGIGRIQPLPGPGTGSYYRFYFSPRKRLLSVVKIAKGERVKNWVTRLTYEDKYPVRVRTSKYVILMKWQNGKVVASRKYRRVFKPKKGDIEFEGETEEDAPVETEADEEEDSDAKKKEIPFNFFYYYKGREIIRVDRLKNYKATPELVAFLEKKDGVKKDEDEEEEAAEEEGEDEEAGTKLTKIPVVDRRDFRKGALISRTIFSKNAIIRKITYHYGTKGEVKGVQRQNWKGENNFHYVNRPFKRIKSKAIVLQRAPFYERFGNYPANAPTQPPYIPSAFKKKTVYLKPGTEIKLLGQQWETRRNGEEVPYYKLQTKGGTTGWVRSEYIHTYRKYLGKMKGVVTAQQARIYAAPDFNAAVTGNLTLNTKVILTSKTVGFVPDSWAQAASGKQTVDYFSSPFFDNPDAEGEEGDGADEVEEDEEDPDKKKKVKKPEVVINDFQKGNPWYKVRYGKKIGWVHGSDIGEQYRRYANHYFIWQAENGHGRLYQFNPEIDVYEPIVSSKWDITGFTRFNKYIQNTNWDIRDINGDGKAELLVRRFLDKSNEEQYRLRNVLLVYNLNQKKAHPLIRIGMSNIRFLRNGPLDDYIENPKPVLLSKKEKAALAAAKEEDEEEAEEEEEEESADDGEEGEEDEADEDDEEEESSGGYKWVLYSAEDVAESAEANESEDGDEAKPKQDLEFKKNYAFRKSRVYFVKKKLGSPAYILLLEDHLKARGKIKGRPLDGKQRRTLMRFGNKLLEQQKKVYKKYYHPNDSQETAGDYIVDEKIP